jgi:formamidopyrimidine-DNA glycosylase
MPELPEVETIVRQLGPVLCGTKLVRLELRDAKLKRVRADSLRGYVIDRVFRLGKQIVFTLVSPRTGQEKFLAVHLRMSGGLVWRPELKGTKKKRTLRETAVTGSREAKPPYIEKYVRAVFHCSKGRVLFVDPRRFGTIAVWSRLEKIAQQGIDPFAAQFGAEKLAELLGLSKQAIKPWLLRQDRLVGIGNIYASEILFAARIDPRREAGSLSTDEVGRLTREIRRVLRRAIELCGTTFSAFRDAAGDEGRFQHFLKVYGREGEPCRKCHVPVKRMTQQGRSTYLCNVCQQ